MKNLSTVKLLSVICVLIWSAGTIQAQELEFGGRVGTSVSFFTNNFKMKGGSPGLLIGGVANYQLADAIQLTGGLDYHQMRGTIVGSPVFGDYGMGYFSRQKESNLTIHSLELSGLGGYKLPLSFLGDAAPYIQGGFSIAYNMGTWDRYTAVYRSDEDRLEFNGKENVKSVAQNWLPAWHVGLRFEVPIDGGLFSKMFLDARLRSSMGPAVRPYFLNGSFTELGIRSLSASIGFTL